MQSAAHLRASVATETQVISWTLQLPLVRNLMVLMSLSGGTLILIEASWRVLLASAMNFPGFSRSKVAALLRFPLKPGCKKPDGSKSLTKSST